MQDIIGINIDLKVLILIKNLHVTNVTGVINILLHCHAIKRNVGNNLDYFVNYVVISVCAGII